MLKQVVGRNETQAKDIPAKQQQQQQQQNKKQTQKQNKKQKHGKKRRKIKKQNKTWNQELWVMCQVNKIYTFQQNTVQS